MKNGLETPEAHRETIFKIMRNLSFSDEVIAEALEQVKKSGGDLMERTAEELEVICQALDEELDRIDALSTSERELRAELSGLQNSICTCKHRIEQGE